MLNSSFPVRTDCNGDNDCCTWYRPCGADEGDCEMGLGQCATGLVCRENNCQVLHAGDKNRGGYSATDDCCEPRKSKN